MAACGPDARRAAGVVSMDVVSDRSSPRRLVGRHDRCFDDGSATVPAPRVFTGAGSLCRRLGDGASASDVSVSGASDFSFFGSGFLSARAPWSCCGRPGGGRPRSCRPRLSLSATWLSTFVPSSGWAISRPRNCSVTLTLCPSSRKLDDVTDLGVEVTLADLRPELHLLDGDVGRLLPRFLGLLRLLVAELAVIHDPADRRVGQRGHFDEVEIELSGQREGIGQRLDPELRPFWADDPNLTGTNALVVPRLVDLGRCYGCSLLRNGHVLPRWIPV